MWTFSPLAPIVRYESPVGNNDVPYPYAVDSDGRIYLMMEQVVWLHPERIWSSDDSRRDDPSGAYFQATLMTRDRGTIPPTLPTKLADLGLEAYFIGDQPYTLTWQAEPERGYARAGGLLSLVLASGKRITLTRRGYINLMQSVGKRLGLTHFPVNRTIRKRE